MEWWLILGDKVNCCDTDCDTVAFVKCADTQASYRGEMRATHSNLHGLYGIIGITGYLIQKAGHKANTDTGGVA